MKQHVLLASVPMDPVWLPTLVLLLLGIGAAISGVAYIRSRKPQMVARAWGVSLICFLLVFASSRALGKPPRSKGLVPASKDSISLVLGGVVLRVDKAPTYVLEVEDTPVLELDTQQSQLRVSGVIGSDDRALATVGENVFSRRLDTDVHPAKDAHAIWVRHGSRRVFVARYDDPSTIEVSGDFFSSPSGASPLISCNDGIRWGDTSLPAGTRIDLRGQGTGAISFGQSGAVRIHSD